MDADNIDHEATQDCDNAEYVQARHKEFWIFVKCAVYLISQYFETYLEKTPCMISDNTGVRWMREIIEGHPERCRRMMRMEQEVFIQLCEILHTSYDLKPSKNLSIHEKVRIFIYALAQGSSNRHIQERFQHSGETVSRIFHEVLKSLCKFAKVLIEPINREFRDIPHQILQDTRYMPHFKDCIGALDGTHIDAIVPFHDQLRFIGRKGRPTQNILAVCSFDMKFTYVLAGFEGSAHDARVLSKALNLNFPKPPPGKYYLVDAGYSQMPGYLGPYRGVRYHLQEYQQGHPPQGLKEVFNKAHSSLRSCIERTFGVWKKRWNMIRSMPSFAYETQVKIVVASMALHNYIRESTCDDEIFQEAEADPNAIDLDDLQANEESSQTEMHSTEIDNLRNQIALSLMSSSM